MTSKSNDSPPPSNAIYLLVILIGLERKYHLNYNLTSPDGAVLRGFKSLFLKIFQGILMLLKIGIPLIIVIGLLCLLLKAIEVIYNWVSETNAKLAENEKSLSLALDKIYVLKSNQGIILSELKKSMAEIEELKKFTGFTLQQEVSKAADEIIGDYL